MPSRQGTDHEPARRLDLREEPHDDALDHVQQAFGTKLDRATVRFGTAGATEGFRTERNTWVRVAKRPRWRINGPAWTGAEAASTIRGVAKPGWLQGVSWIDVDRDIAWRADEQELVQSPTVADALDLSEAQPPDSWWAGLHTSLAHLGQHPTERIGMRQEHLNKRISEVFDNQVDTTIDEWVTAHADLHWSNLTVDGQLLDWEDWGAAPRGLDATYLWGASLPYPKLAARVRHEFDADLQTRSGKLAQLLYCSNVIRIAAKRDRVTPHLAPARSTAAVLLADLRS